MKQIKVKECGDHVDIKRQHAYEKLYERRHDDPQIIIEAHMTPSREAMFSVYLRDFALGLADLVHSAVYACDYDKEHLIRATGTVRGLQWLDQSIEEGNVPPDNLILVAAGDISVIRHLETRSVYGEHEALWTQLRDLATKHEDRLTFVQGMPGYIAWDRKVRGADSRYSDEHRERARQLMDHVGNKVRRQ
jgi:hypothetical protein